MKKLCLGMCISLMFLTMVGCGASNTGKTDSANVNSNREVKVGLKQTAANLDPTKSQSDIDFKYIAQLYDALLQKDSKGNIVGALAENYTVSDDKLKITLKLHKNVKFSNGDELKASDVDYTINRYKSIAGSYTNYLKNIESVEIVDDYNLILHMKKSTASILTILTGMYIMNEKATEAAGDKYGLSKETVCGTGPYMISEWIVGGDMVLTANENYFEGALDIKKIRMSGITDSTAAVVALQTGELDLYLDDIPGNYVEQIKNDMKLTFSTFPSSVFNYIVLNTKKGIFSDLHMRQAVAYALNRNDALTVGTNGYGTITNTVASSAFIGNPTDAKWYSQDVEKAKSLVKEAGKEGASITLHTIAFDPYIQLATLVQNQLSAIGLKVKVQQLENNAFIDQVFTKNDYEIACTFWNGSKDFGIQAQSFLHTDFMGYSGNVSMYSNPKMDAALNAGNETFDIKERQAFYAQAMDIMYNDVPLIPLHFMAGSRAYSKDMTVDPVMLQYSQLKHFHWSK